MIRRIKICCILDPARVEKGYEDVKDSVYWVEVKPRGLGPDLFDPARIFKPPAFCLPIKYQLLLSQVNLDACTFPYI